MKRLKYVASATDDIIVKTADKTVYTFPLAEDWELDISNDSHADELLRNQVFQDITES